MKATVKKSDVVINLELTEEEFNTILLSVGATPYYSINTLAKEREMSVSSPANLYNELAKFSNALKETKWNENSIDIAFIDDVFMWNYQHLFRLN